MNDFVPPRLKTSFAVSTADEHAENSFKALDKILSAISQMRNTIQDLERVRAQYVIHLRNYQTDCEIMRSLYDDIKKKLNSTDPFQNFESMPNQENTQMQQFSNQINPRIDQSQPLLPLTTDIGHHNSFMNTPVPITNNLSNMIPIMQQNSNSSFTLGSQQQNQLVNLYVKQESIPNTSIQKIDINWSLLDPDTNQPYNPSLNPASKGLFTSNNIVNLFTLETNSIICSIKYDPSGTRFAYANGRFIFIGLTNSGVIEKYAEMPRVPSRHEITSHVICFSPDGQYIAVSCSILDICIFNISGVNCHLMKKFEGHTQTVTSLAFTTDSSRLISGGFDGFIFIWNMSNFTLINRISHSPSSMAADQSTSMNINISNESIESSSNASNNANENGEKDSSNDYSIVAVSVGCNDSFVAVGFMKGFVGIYDINFKNVVTHFHAHDEILLSVSASKTDPVILTASQDKTIKMWSIDSSASCLGTFAGHNDYVLSSCFSLDGQIVISGSKDETIRGWSTASGQCLFVIQAHKNTVFEVNHHPLKNEFISCSNGLICTWSYNIPN